MPFFSFDTENNSWETIQSMNVARMYPAVTILNGYIYIAGGSFYGYDYDFDYRKKKIFATDSVELFDPRTDEWTKLTPTKEHRGIFTLTESNGFLFAMGGETRTIERFEPYKNSWKEVCELTSHCELISNGMVEKKI